MSRVYIPTISKLGERDQDTEPINMLHYLPVGMLPALLLKIKEATDKDTQLQAV